MGERTQGLPPAQEARASTPDLSIFFRKQKNCWACGTVGFDPWPPRAHGVRGATVFHVRLFPFYTDRSVEASVMSLKFSIIVEIREAMNCRTKLGYLKLKTEFR